VQGEGCWVKGAERRVQEFMVYGLWLIVYGVGIRVWSPGLV